MDRHYGFHPHPLCGSAFNVENCAMCVMQGPGAPEISMLPAAGVRVTILQSVGGAGQLRAIER
jgi:hypothetical protein